MVLLFPLGGCLVVEAGVQPLGVVAVDPYEDRLSGGGSVGEPVSVDQFAFE